MKDLRLIATVANQRKLVEMLTEDVKTLNDEIDRLTAENNDLSGLLYIEENYNDVISKAYRDKIKECEKLKETIWKVACGDYSDIAGV
mgnify:CR=1 FL=1